MPRKAAKKQLRSTASRHPQPGVAAEPPPMVSARWLATALALTFLLAAFCAYGTLCLLFYQGQWQMLFHPSRAITTTPANASLAYDNIRFDVTESGIPRLEGWWIPAAPQSRYGGDTLLYLHDARGDLSDCVPALAALHTLGITVFAIDYRGFGQSTGQHPTERLATDDSVAAWTYLTDTRHIPARSIVVYGDGVGATFAARIALRFAPAGVILENPNPPARQIFAADARARILPLWLLQKEYLDPAADLAHAHVPRLFLDLAPGAEAAPPSPGRTYQLFAVSSAPKQYYDLRSAPVSAVNATLRRFLDEVLH